MALLEFFKSNRDIVLSQTIQQLVSNCGDGDLRDGSASSQEFRTFLTLIPADSVVRFGLQCLKSPFDNSGFVLQDIVNEFGRRLHFEVEDGLYHGKQGSIGFDGIWRYSGEPAIVIEVKTTDTYSVRLETTNGYKEALAAQGKISQSASMLIVVGKEKTEALEAQVRGSRFARDIRVISVDGLMKLVQIREKSNDPATATQIRQLLHPFENTKVDKMIDVIFTAATDVESQQEVEKDEPELAGDGSDTKLKQSHTDTDLIDAKRQQSIEGFSSLKQLDLIKRSRTFFWTADKEVRVCCTVSKRYENDAQPYFYAYHPKWDAFLKEGQGFLILCCLDRDDAFAVPRTWFAENKQNLYVAEKASGTRWLIPLTTLAEGSLAIDLKDGTTYSLAPHRFTLQQTKARSTVR